MKYVLVKLDVKDVMEAGRRADQLEVAQKLCKVEVLRDTGGRNFSNVSNWNKNCNYKSKIYHGQNGAQMNKNLQPHPGNQA